MKLLPFALLAFSQFGHKLLPRLYTSGEESPIRFMSCAICQHQTAPSHPTPRFPMTREVMYRTGIHSPIQIFMRRRSSRRVPTLRSCFRASIIECTIAGCLPYTAASSLTDGAGTLQLGFWQPYRLRLFSLSLLSSRINRCGHGIPLSLLL